MTHIPRWFLVIAVLLMLVLLPFQFHERRDQVQKSTKDIYTEECTKLKGVTVFNGKSWECLK